jgi:hypothetical protein
MRGATPREVSFVDGRQENAALHEAVAEVALEWVHPGRLKAVHDNVSLHLEMEQDGVVDEVQTRRAVTSRYSQPMTPLVRNLSPRAAMSSSKAATLAGSSAMKR